MEDGVGGASLYSHRMCRCKCSSCVLRRAAWVTDCGSCGFLCRCGGRREVRTPSRGCSVPGPSQAALGAHIARRPEGLVPRRPGPAYGCYRLFLHVRPQYRPIPRPHRRSSCSQKARRRPAPALHRLQTFPVPRDLSPSHSPTSPAPAPGCSVPGLTPSGAPGADPRPLSFCVSLTSRSARAQGPVTSRCSCACACVCVYTCLCACVCPPVGTGLFPVGLCEQPV